MNTTRKTKTTTAKVTAKTPKTPAKRTTAKAKAPTKAAKLSSGWFAERLAKYAATIKEESVLGALDELGAVYVARSLEQFKRAGLTPPKEAPTPEQVRVAGFFSLCDTWHIYESADTSQRFAGLDKKLGQAIVDSYNAFLELITPIGAYLTDRKQKELERDWAKYCKDYPFNGKFFPTTEDLQAIAAKMDALAKSWGLNGI